MILKCPGCPMLFRAPRAYRTYCSNDCQKRHIAKENDLLFAELEWIAGTDTWDNIASRLGFASRPALERWLQRRGEYEWAVRVHSTGMPRTYIRAA
jgi:hypothetical protein